MHTGVGWVPASPGRKGLFWVPKPSQNLPKIGPNFQNWAGIGTGFGAQFWKQAGIGFGAWFWN